MPQFEAYHGKDSAHHQTRFNALAPKGWRMVSLSAHGDPGDPRYSAVWVKVPGPRYIAVHDLPVGKYQNWFNDQKKAGYAPVLVTATGGGWQRRGRCRLREGAQSSLDRQARAREWLRRGPEHDRVLVQESQAGWLRAALGVHLWIVVATALHRRLACGGRGHWNWRVAESASGYQTWFNAFGEIPLRPGFVTLSEHQLYFAAFRDDAIGEWYARHDMTGDGYQQEFNTFKKKGFYPICVQGGGEGGKTRYAAIFVKRHEPLPRVWTVRGAGLSKFDQAVKAFMQANGVRVGQLSIAKNGVFKAQRAYTWAAPGYPVTEVSHLVRIASPSKMFTCACIQRLYDLNTLKEGDTVFAKLGITKKALSSQTVDSRINNITVEQLVDHEGGWDSSTAGDPVFRMRKIANDLGLSGSATKFDLVRYMYGEPLQFKPGSKSQYSNIGYTTLAYLVEKVTGQSYEQYLRSTILLPEGIGDVRRARTKREQRLANEVFYDDPNVGMSAAEPTKDKRTAFCHGGEGWTTEAMDGSGGLCATANALVRFIRSHAVWGRGGRMASAARTGSMAGVSSRAESRTDGVDFAFIFNTRHLLKMPVDDLASTLTSLISTSSL